MAEAFTDYEELEKVLETIKYKVIKIGKENDGSKRYFESYDVTNIVKSYEKSQHLFDAVCFLLADLLNIKLILDNTKDLNNIVKIKRCQNIAKQIIDIANVVRDSVASRNKFYYILVYNHSRTLL